MGLSTHKVFPYSFASLPSVRLCEWETLKENWQMRWREKIFSVSRQHLSSSRKELECHSLDRFSSRYICTSLEIPAPAGSACWHSRSSTIGASFPSFQRAAGHFRRLSAHHTAPSSVLPKVWAPDMPGPLLWTFTSDNPKSFILPNLGVMDASAPFLLAFHPPNTHVTNSYFLILSVWNTKYGGFSVL